MVETLEKPKLNRVERKAQIITRLVTGETNTSIAKDFNVTHQAISRTKKENQPFINQEQTKLIQLLPTATEIVTDELEANRLLTKRIRIDPYNVDPFKVSLKSELNKTIRDLWKISGILRPQALINVNQDNRTQTTVISDNVLNLFSPHAKELIDTEVVDTISDTTNEGNSDNPDNVISDT